MTIALYAGSFDPPTNGHKWIIEQMSRNYEKGIIAIGINSDKKERFSFSDKLDMLKSITSPYKNISITSYSGQYTADFSDTVGANHLIRGIRNPNDLLYENDIRYINETINPKIETVFYTPPKNLLQVSSSMVMGLMGCLGWEPIVADMVPEIVMEYLIGKQQETDAKDLKMKFPGWIIDFYCSKDRFYHGISHLKTCLFEFNRVKDYLHNDEWVKYALLFHDSVYRIGAPNNEVESAKLAFDWIKEDGLSRDTAKIVYDLVIKTDHKTKPVTNDEKYIVDIDIAGFGYSKRIFDYNNKLIRKEYSMVSDEDYNKGRKALLQSFLDRDRIYYTDDFYDRYEQKARLNLSEAIIEMS